MIQTLIFLTLTFLTVAAIIRIILLSILRVIAKLTKRANPKHITRSKKTAVFLAVVVILNAGLITFSQLTASTPGIVDSDGNTPENSISEMIKLDLNGRKQWLTIRGWDKSKPVLLFLAGGPGGSQLAAVRNELSELEKHFVVVNWDQPGSGKSHFAEKASDINVETYIQDGDALTNYLKERFSQEKIFIVGESWGSALGIFLIDRYPDSYRGFIGTGQMVDFVETEQIDYLKAMEIAAEKNDTATIERLKENGMPPYYGKDLTFKSAVYLNYLSANMAGNPSIYNPGYNTLRDVGASEYGLLDKISYFRGIVITFNNVYQQLYDIDLRTDYSSLSVPVYFFIGRHDLNAPVSLSEDYYNTVEAPQKKFIWFEHSGHSPWINENIKFAEEVISCFLENE